MRSIENEARLANKYVKDSVVVDPHPKKMAVVWIGFLKKAKQQQRGFGGSKLTSISKITTDVTFWATELNRIYPTIYGL